MQHSHHALALYTADYYNVPSQPVLCFLLQIPMETDEGGIPNDRTTPTAQPGF